MFTGKEGEDVRCLWAALWGRQERCLLRWVLGCSCLIALGFSTVTFLFLFFSPQINWYFIKLAFWSVSDLGLLLGTG